MNQRKRIESCRRQLEEAERVFPPSSTEVHVAQHNYERALNDTEAGE